MASSSQTNLTPISPREYQTELLERAKDENIVIVLATGSGKTLIAVLLTQHFSHELGPRSVRDSSVASTNPTDTSNSKSSIASDASTGPKWTVFLAPTIHLVEQQGKYISQHTGLTVATFVGTHTSVIDKADWNNRVTAAHVIVSTPEIFLQALTHGFMHISKVNLLIIDECHHAISTSSSSSHPYAQIMRHHYHRLKKKPNVSLPHVLGFFSATINCFFFAYLLLIAYL